MQTAATACAERLAKAIAQIDALRATLIEQDAAAKRDEAETGRPVHWGHAAVLGSVNERLAELARFIA